MNYLASPPLVVAYALAGTMDRRPHDRPHRHRRATASRVYLADLWPSEEEIAETIRDLARLGHVPAAATRRCSRATSAGGQIPVAAGRDLRVGPRLDLRAAPAVPRRHGRRPDPVTDIEGARVLAVLGDSVTTDHISPAGSIGPSTPAGRYLTDHGVERADFNSYGTRRGNHEVMVRGTFANVRLRNQLAPGTEGGVTLHLPDGEETTIYEAVACATRPTASRSSCWPARSTAPGRAGTGRPRARPCSASRPRSPRATSASTAPT